MIHSDSLTDGHLRTIAGRLNIGDTQLLGRMVHALYLVELLAVEELPFVFKGGTCLSLLVNRIDRLSIDVDIEVSHAFSQEAIESTLNRICNQGKVFTRWQLERRQSDRTGSRHYKLFYAQQLAQGTYSQEHILLDVVWTSSEHTCVAERELIHDALLIDGPPIRIIAPTIEGLLGDKLTACAPLTVGVPIVTRMGPSMGLTYNKHLEMVKQLFDVNVLIPYAAQWESVGSAFERTLDVQRQVFGQDFNREQVVQDLARRALAMFNLLDTSYHQDLEIAHRAGHTSLKNYLISQRDFLFEHVRMAALRAAYVGHCIRTGESPQMKFPAEATPALDNEQIRLIIKGLSKPLRSEALTLVKVLLESGY